MPWTPSVPPRWGDLFDDREQKHIAFCVEYERNYKHGAPGHLDMLVIAKLVDCLVDAQTNLNDMHRKLAGIRSVETPEHGDALPVPAALLAQLVDDIEVFARLFHFVVPDTVSKIKALLHGLEVGQWRDVRDLNDSTQVY